MTEKARRGTTPGTEAAPGRREAGKAERRRRIIRAAQELIRETGNAGLSMRSLAARAGVSVATPYNLFGSKRAIVLALLDDIREYQDRFAHVEVTDPLERLFMALNMAVKIYVDDPAFYKTLWGAVYDASDDVRTQIYNPSRDTFWRGLLQACADAGVIAPDLDIDLLLKALYRGFGAAMLDWVVGDLEPELVAPTIRHGHGLMLLGAALPAWRGPLEARVREAQARVSAGRARQTSTRSLRRVKSQRSSD